MQLILTPAQKAFLQRNFLKVAKAKRAKQDRDEGRRIEKLADKFTQNAEIIDLKPTEAELVLAIAEMSSQSIRTITLPAYSGRDGSEEYVKKAEAQAEELEALVKLIQKKL